MKGLAFPAGMAADLALVEDQRQGVGQKPDHGEHNQGCGLVDRWVFEVAVRSDGLKDFCIDSPTAAAELMNEQRGDRAEFEIGGVEIGALLRHRDFAFAALVVFLGDRDTAPVLDTNRFDNSHQAIRDGPVDLRQVPILNFAVRFLVNARGQSLRQALGLAQQLGLILFQGENPGQTQPLHFFDEGRLQAWRPPMEVIADKERREYDRCCR